MAVDRSYAFLSYARLDREYASRLARFLEERGIEIWYDRHAVPGKRWEELLIDHVSDSRAVIVVMSERAAHGEGVPTEIQIAKRRAKRIFPLLLDGERFPSLAHLQDESVPDGTMPGDEWVRTVRAYVNTPPEPPPRTPPPPWRKMAVVVAAGVVLVGVLVWRLGDTPHATAPGCGGLAAHIDHMSTVSPGHTGHTPQLTVTVCKAAPPDHQYWIMDYADDSGTRAFFAKTAIDGAAGTAPAYTVTHNPATPVGSTRHYVVVDVPSNRTDDVKSWSANEDLTPIVQPPASAPPDLTIISNAQPATL